MSGFYPAQSWPIVFGAWVVVVLAIPFRDVPEASKLWKWGAASWLFIPWASPAVAAALVLIGMSAAAHLLPGKKFLREASILASMSMIWLVSLLSSNIYAHIEERVQVPPGASLSIRAVGTALGGDFSNGAKLAYASSDANIIVLPSLDKFGGEYLVVVLIAFVTASLLCRFSRKRVLLLACALLAYSAGRAIWLVDSFASFDQIVWWNEDTLVESFLPGILIVTILLNRGRNVIQRENLNRRQFRFAWASFALGVFLVCFSWNSTPPGRMKSGRVLFDEAHGGWETSLMPLNTRWYGSRTVYNYRNFREALEHYFDVQIQSKPISDEDLQGISVLILKTPSVPYGEKERASIRRFVSRGGGVWFIGDHTDAFGMSTYLNQVVGDFGYQFRKDAYLEMPAGRNLWTPGAYSPPTSREIPLFLFYTGCSLQSPWLAADLMSGGRQLLDEMDLSKGTFFGDLYGQLKEPVSHTTFSSHMSVGKGRVAVWTDSTLFSNFSFYIPGKLEVAISTVDWLNRKNNDVDIRLSMLSLGFLFLGFGLLCSKKTDLALAAAAGLVIVPFALEFYGKTFYPEIKPKVAFRKIAFYEPNLTPHFPVALPLDEPLSFGYLSAYVATQRIGLRPIIVKRTEEISKDVEAVVYIPGAVPINKSEINNLLQWVKSGGKLIVLDGGLLSSEEMAKFLEAAEGGSLLLPEQKNVPLVPLVVLKERELVDATVKAHRSGSDSTTLGLQGGKPFLLDRSSRFSVASEYPCGLGKLVISSTVRAFSDLSLGEVKTVPEEWQLARLQILYRWYSDR